MIRKQCLNCRRVYPAESTICSDDGMQLATVLVDSLIGELLNARYRITEELGRGGMGIVYKAIHEVLGRPVAIKMLLNDLGKDEISLKRFEVEAMACSRLNHPNVIKVYDFAVSEFGLPYIVMDYIEGKPLDKLLKDEEEVSTARALPLLLQICNALDHAHRRQVVHRDLKPSNIMVLADEDGQDHVVLLDFGIAKLFTHAGKNYMRLTKPGEVFGSPLYMSPEQCMGQLLDHRSDIYSIGCLMYEMLSGQPPLVGANYLETIFKQVTDDPPLFSTIAPDSTIPCYLEDIVRRCLVKKVEQRYQSMTDLKQDLQKAHTLFLSGSKEQSLPVDFAPEEEEIVGHYRNKAEAGDPSAQYDLAWYYKLGDYIEKDLSLAFYWFMKAAQNGYAEAQHNVGLMFEKGEGIEADATAAIDWYLKGAEQGHVQCEYDLGYCYHHGIGVDEDLVMSYYWYRQAANKGFADAENCVGHAYELGYGVEIDLEEAAKWYVRAAEQGNMYAQYNVADLHLQGKLQNPDLEGAMAWLMSSADQGYDMAQFDLGMKYLDGILVPKDEKKFVDWMERAAQQDYVEAQVELADYYERTAETIEDWEGAQHWYEQAAEKGNAYAQERFFECKKKIKQLKRKR